MATVSKTCMNPGKTIFLRAITLAALLLLAAPAAVQAQFSYYTNGNGTCTIIGYSGPGGAVIIPTNINSLTVTGIGTSAFIEHTSLTSVTIPGTVTSIGTNAFYECSSLTSITMANGSIGVGAFYKCSSLTSLTLANGVTSIGQSAFNFCTGLTSLTIPGSVTNIGELAFFSCSSLTNVTFAYGVTSIGTNAFQSCGSLTSVTIPGSVTNIAPDPFERCPLTAITVDTNNPAYSSMNGVLFDITQSTLIEYPGGVGGSYMIPASVTSIGYGAFEACTSLTNITIPNSVTSIGVAAFISCTGLTNVAIPANVTIIGTNAFYGCSSLTSVTIPGGVTGIGAGAFSGCFDLTNVTIDNGVTSIGTNAFYGCSSLMSVTIPGSVTSIGEYAFYDCYNLTNATIAYGVTSIEIYAFEDCTSLTSVTIPGNVTDFGYVFAGCTGLTSVTIAYGVTTIAPNAFEDCSSLISVTIPGSVTSIGTNAFYDCNSLGATLQFSNPWMEEHILKVRRDRDFMQCLHGYVGSGMPVILFTDICRLAGLKTIDGESVYTSNNVNVELFLGDGHYRHSVTVVGGSIWEDKGTRRFISPNSVDCKFLLLDPSTMPFLIASVYQLAQVGDNYESNRQLRHPAMIPVTPSQVKMPLQCVGEPVPDKWSRGLIEISRRCPIAAINPESREFILASLDQVSPIRVSRHFIQDRSNEIAQCMALLPAECVRHLGRQCNHMVWLECGEERVRIWDAEIVPDNDVDITAYLLGSIAIEDYHVALRLYTPKGVVVVSIPTTSKFPPLAKSRKVSKVARPTALAPCDQFEESSSALKRSLITSFTVHGTKRAAEFWNQSAAGTKFAELYMCMQSDVSDLLARPGSDHAVMVLSDIASNKIMSPAEFAKLFQGACAGIEIVGFATFMPELMGPNFDSYKQAQTALTFLVEVATHLAPARKPFTIEIVGGHRLQGIWRANTDEGPLYAVNRLDPKTAFHELITRVEPIAKRAWEVGGVQLALEIEPGPLFILDPHGGDRHANPKPWLLEELCKLIEHHKSKYIQQSVGINLDIPHCAFLSRIDLPWFEQTKVVRDRIIHAHISDHDNGHFCDNVVGVCNQLEVFQPWLQFLMNLSLEHRANGRPLYSGFVSTELEACKSSALVAASLGQVKTLISQLRKVN
jgi:sugar phosphate isomerase/epimerase